MTKLKKRLEAPSKDDKNYISVKNGGYNRALVIDKNSGSCLPNCVGYVHGRWCELVGKNHKLATTNAETLWGNTKDGYARGSTPKLGAVLCQRRGVVGNSADGAGHVSIVEKINEDGSILVSQSHYNGNRFDTRVYKKGSYNWNLLVFQGFIYPPTNYTQMETYKKTLPKITLKKGMKGLHVMYLQSFLNWAGYKVNGKKLVVDGVFGTKTDYAVRNFQTSNGLYVDGVFGEKSLAKAKTIER